MDFLNRLSNVIAALLLITMAALLLWGAFTNSATMDELAHIPAGYSYLARQDMRLNPEHPPLIKDLAAIPLLFLNLYFPADHPSWTEGINEQWWFGSEFLWRSGNPGDTIVIAARFFPIIITLALGWLIFSWTKHRGGLAAGLIALALFVFSPVFLAHGALVTTDVGAAFGMFAAMWALLWYFSAPSFRRTLVAGAAFGAALLAKFSTVLLVPLFAILAFAWWFLTKKYHVSHAGDVAISVRPENALSWALKIIGGTVLIGIFGLLLVNIVYAFNTWHIPKDRLLRDTQFILTSFPNRAVAEATAAMTQNSFTKPISWWMTGNLMAFQRSSAGNTGYFLGEISAAGWPQYFPVVYLLKVPLVFHVLSVFALFTGLVAVARGFRETEEHGHRGFRRAAESMMALGRRYFVEISLVLFIALYWLISIRSPLNIGIRHLAPVFPPMMFLIGRAMAAWILSAKPSFRPDSPLISALRFLRWSSSAGLRSVIVIVMVTVGALGALVHSPHYIPYFNVLGGGVDHGWNFVVDSNYDWGQDMKRLKWFVEQNDIDQIRVDYFGGTDARYYLNAHFLPYNPREEGPVSGWLAVSATFLQAGRANPAPGFNEPTGYYRWLDAYSPVARAGKSIFIYYIP